MKKITMKNFKALANTISPIVLCHWDGSALHGEDAAAVKVAIGINKGRVRASRAVVSLFKELSKDGRLGELHSIKKEFRQ